MIYSNKRIVLFALTMCVIALSSVKAQGTRASIGRNRKTMKASGGKESSKSSNKELTLYISFTGTFNPNIDPMNIKPMKPVGKTGEDAERVDQKEDEDTVPLAIDDQIVIEAIVAALTAVDPQSLNRNRHLQQEFSPIDLLGTTMSTDMGSRTDMESRTGMGSFFKFEKDCKKNPWFKLFYCVIDIEVTVPDWLISAEQAKYAKGLVNSERFRINFATALATAVAIISPDYGPPFIVIPLPVGTSIMLEESRD